MANMTQRFGVCETRGPVLKRREETPSLAAQLLVENASAGCLCGGAGPGMETWEGLSWGMDVTWLKARSPRGRVQQVSRGPRGEP